MAEKEVQQPQTPEARPEAKSTATLADQYEFGEGEQTPETSQNSQPVRSAERQEETTPPASAGATKPPPPQDPVTGRFVKRDTDASLLSEPEPAPSPHSSATVQKALDYGIPDEVIASLSSEQLTSLVRAQDARVREQGVEGMHEQLTHDAIQRGQQTIQERGVESPPPVPASTASSAQEGDFSLGIDFVKEGWDPTVQQAFTKLESGLSRALKENKELRQTVEQLKTFEISRQNDTIAERCDRVFLKYEQHFGKTRGKEMQPNDPHFLRRLAVLNLVERDRSRSSLEAKIERAVGLIYGKAPAKAQVATPSPPDPLQQRTEAWDEATLRRPTHRNGSAEPKGTKLAEESVAQFQRDIAGSDEANGVADDGDFI